MTKLLERFRARHTRSADTAEPPGEAVPGGSGSSTPSRAGLPKRIWVTAGALTLAVVVYVASVIVVDLPPSPARNALVATADHVVNPWFAQQWTLFAPNPPTSNAHLYLLVEYKRGSGRPDPAPVDLTQLYHDIAGSRLWAPPRLNRVTMDLAVEIARIALYAPGAKASSAQTAAEAEADIYFSPSVLGTISPLTPKDAELLAVEVILELQRLLSASAHDVIPDPSQIQYVRGMETGQAIAPFTSPHEQEQTATLFDTGWIPYLSSVSQ